MHINQTDLGVKLVAAHPLVIGISTPGEGVGTHTA
jgi:hypothetical protein